MMNKVREIDYKELHPFYLSLQSGDSVMIRKDITDHPYLYSTYDLFRADMEPEMANEYEDGWNCKFLSQCGGVIVNITDLDESDRTCFITNIPYLESEYADWVPDTCFVPLDYYLNKSFNSLLD